MKRSPTRAGKLPAIDREAGSPAPEQKPFTLPPSAPPAVPPLIVKVALPRLMSSWRNIMPPAHRGRATIDREVGVSSRGVIPEPDFPPAAGCLTAVADKCAVVRSRLVIKEDLATDRAHKSNRGS